MRFCIHDWYNQDSDGKSVRWSFYSDGFASFFVGSFVGGAIGYLVAVLIGLILSLPFAIVAGLLSGGGLLIWVGEMCHQLWCTNYDPWITADRICIKCDKTEFNYTSLVKKEKAKAKADREAYETAKSRFKDYKEFWEKANA